MPIANEALLDVIIVSPDATVLETSAQKVLVPGTIQELAILPNHTPLYAELVKGVVKIENEAGKVQEIDIESGIIRVRRNKVSIILGFDREIEKTPPR
jgi:F-type H+-transporting ATPase subunit epsilon